MQTVVVYTAFVLVGVNTLTVCHWVMIAKTSVIIRYCEMTLWVMRGYTMECSMILPVKLGFFDFRYCSTRDTPLITNRTDRTNERIGLKFTLILWLTTLDYWSLPYLNLIFDRMQDQENTDARHLLDSSFQHELD